MGETRITLADQLKEAPLSQWAGIIETWRKRMDAQRYYKAEGRAMELSARGVYDLYSGLTKENK